MTVLCGVRTHTWERFRDKFTVDEKGCWIAKVTDDGGYGQFWYEDEGRRGHAVAVEIMSGKRQRQVNCDASDHLCKNRACWNPFHVIPSTQLENALRGGHRNRDKTKCHNGHEFTPENTYIYKGHRQCKECQWRSGRRAKRNQQVNNTL